MVASAKRDRIRTPWKTRWQRFCYHGLPVVAFAFCVLVVGRMWLDQGSMPNAVGRVEAERVNITAAFDGKLMPLEELPGGRWKQFDQVQKGQVIARLDDRPLQAELQALRADASALKAELAATQVDARLNHYDRQHEHFREAAELAYQVERYRLQVLDQQAQVEEARLQLQQLDAQIDLLNKAYSSGLGVSNDGASYQADRETLGKLLQTRNDAVRQAETNLAAAERRLQSLPQVDSPDLEALIAPIRDSISAAEARVEQVRAQIESLVIRSPVAGMVSLVHAHPGQGIQTGDWILTVAANDADSIVGYVPAANRFRPVEGMPVGVRLRVPGSRMVKSVIQRVGSQWETMPLELSRDPQAPQLALPIRIKIPQGLDARPGEVVDIRFYRERDGELAQGTLTTATSPRVYASATRRTSSSRRLSNPVGL